MLRWNSGGETEAIFIKNDEVLSLRSVFTQRNRMELLTGHALFVWYGTEPLIVGNVWERDDELLSSKVCGMRRR